MKSRENSLTRLFCSKKPGLAWGAVPFPQGTLVLNQAFRVRVRRTRTQKAWLSEIAHLVWREISRELLNQAFFAQKPGLAWGAVLFHRGPCRKAWLTP